MTTTKNDPLVVAKGCRVTYKNKEYLEGKKLPKDVSDEDRAFLIKSKQVVTDEGDTTAQAD